MDAFAMEEPNGAKANVALGSNTPVSPGKPYLVQINPTAAEEIGPASYDITVVRKCTFLTRLDQISYAKLFASQN